MSPGRLDSADGGGAGQTADMPLTLIAESTVEVAGRVESGRVLVAAADLPGVTGWALAPEGLCRGDVCVPVRGRDDLVTDDPNVGPLVDLAAVATVLGQPLVVDAEESVVALGPPSDERPGLRVGDPAPPLALDGLDGRPLELDHFVGKKKLLLAWASW